MKPIRLPFRLPNREGSFKMKQMVDSSNFFLEATEMSIETNLYVERHTAYKGRSDDLLEWINVERIFNVRFRLFQWDKNGLVIEKSMPLCSSFVSSMCFTEMPTEILLFQYDKIRLDLIVRSD